MYSIANYGSMIADPVRMAAYEQALRQTVKANSIVLDIGTGTGIFALLACRLGARRVYAIEPSDAIQVAREIARANGYADRIEFMQERSTNITLLEQADVIVSDIRGVLPTFQHHVPVIVDARKRLLAPDGVLIPQRDTLWVAVVETTEQYKKYLQPWDDCNYGFAMQAARRLVLNTWRKQRVKPEQILLPAQAWATLDYPTVTEPDLRGEVTWTVEHAGLAHGLAVWFDATLAHGIQFSNAPDQPELIYSNALFPFLAPLALVPGDVVAVTLQADLVGDDYIWTWRTKVLQPPNQVKASFHQSTFFGASLAPAQLRKSSADYRPRLHEEGKIEQFILAQMDGQLTLQAIAEQLAERWPQRFPTWRVALTHAGELAQKHSQ